MIRLAIWAWSVCMISCMTGSSGLTWLCRQENTLGNAAHALPSKPGSPKLPWKYHGHTLSRAGSPWLPVPGTWERPGWECCSGHRPFHQVCPGICNQDPNHPNYCQTLWDTFIVHYGLPVKILTDQGWNFESVGDWPLWADGDVEDTDQSMPSANQWPMWEVQLHSDWYAGNVTQGEEVRVEEPHWNVGSHLQLHPKLSYRVQPLLPHVWETTSPSSRCDTWSGSMYHHGAKHFEMFSKNEEMHQMGSKKSWSLSGERGTKTQVQL